MTEQQKQLQLFKISHKLLVIKHNDIYKVIPIVGTIAYTVWILKHKYDFKVVANVQGTDDQIKEVIPPFSTYTDLEGLKEKCTDVYIKFTYIATPTVPEVLPDELLKSPLDYLKFFKEDGSALLLADIGDQESIKEYYRGVLKLIANGEHVIAHKKGFSYFDSYITQLSLLGGIKGVLNKYPSKIGTQVSQVQTLKNILNRKASTVQMYINRYTNELKAVPEVKTVPHTNSKLKDIEFTLPKAIREYYEILIEPYIRHQRRLNV